jgi:hypothetical protein
MHRVQPVRFELITGFQHVLAAKYKFLQGVPRKTQKAPPRTLPSTRRRGPARRPLWLARPRHRNPSSPLLPRQRPRRRASPAHASLEDLDEPRQSAPIWICAVAVTAARLERGGRSRSARFGHNWTAIGGDGGLTASPGASPRYLLLLRCTGRHARATAQVTALWPGSEQRPRGW